MADETKPGTASGSHPREGGQDPSGLVPEADEILGTGAQTETPAAEETEALRRELEETRQSMLRALADAENVRRRAQRDVADARTYAITSFARDLLSVADNFKRALSTVSDPDAADLPAEVKGLLDGVRMTERELRAVFERHGVKTIEPMGEKFDPNRHQAMFEIDNPDVASGTVVQVMQAGAVIGDRVLRPAMVGVSKGGPKPGTETAQPSAEGAAGDGGGETETGREETAG